MAPRKQHPGRRYSPTRQVSNEQQRRVRAQETRSETTIACHDRLLRHRHSPWSACFASIVCSFRRLLEKHKLTERLFAKINAHLSERGLLVGKGTMVDATIINAPSSTKNAKQARDAEMHQTRKGKQWYFGMKVHTGTDVVADVNVLGELLHGA